MVHMARVSNRQTVLLHALCNFLEVSATLLVVRQKWHLACNESVSIVPKVSLLGDLAHPVCAN